MPGSIGYRETTDPRAGYADRGDGLAVHLDPSRRVALRFRLQLGSKEDLEALRYARRVMIREERTRGLDWEEPSIEDPIFTVTDISWFALASQAAWCREKIAELVERANRARGGLQRTGP